MDVVAGTYLPLLRRLQLVSSSVSVQDSIDTALNSSGDVFFTATAEEFDRKKKGE